MGHARNPGSQQHRGFSASNGSERHLGAWPPFCCVAAFVAASLEKLGHTNVDRESLAHNLGIAVAPTCRNPWHLRVETDPNRQGLSVASATVAIPRVLKTHDPELSFRHVRLSEVTLGLIEDVLVQATHQGCVVGIGYDISRLRANGATEMRHVTRIEAAAESEYAVILDDSDSYPPRPWTIKWFDLLPAVNAANDGYWLIGTRAQLYLSAAP
jgi:hypothetical protein